MKIDLYPVFVLTLLCAPTVAPMAQTRGLPPGAIHVDRAGIVDATGFEAPMAASACRLSARSSRSDPRL